MTRTEREDGRHGCKTQLSTNAKYGNTNKNILQIGVTLSQTIPEYFSLTAMAADSYLWCLLETRSL